MVMWYNKKCSEAARQKRTIRVESGYMNLNDILELRRAHLLYSRHRHEPPHSHGRIASLGDIHFLPNAIIIFVGASNAVLAVPRTFALAVSEGGTQLSGFEYPRAQPNSSFVGSSCLDP